MSVGIPEDKDHATGVEKEELDYGEDRYNRDALSGPYGTKESPVLVPSKLDNRFVGCLGGGERVISFVFVFIIRSISFFVKILFSCTIHFFFIIINKYFLKKTFLSLWFYLGCSSPLMV